MDKKHIIISETPRPFWQLVIAALIFTVSIAVLLLTFFTMHLSFQGFIDTIYIISFSVFISIVATGFCSQKRVYLDLENSKFKPSLEIGFVKIGKWKTINNYEYVSIFHEPSTLESHQFEVNLWYDRNKHFELYTRNNFEDAISVGFDISEKLNIDLLDATIPNNFKWIDKEALKQGTSKTKKG
ncbi:hypothetical protein [Lacinutrix mariniflava]|uniref:hypothetical protein n=1 Tax=Lacinutrix mariniflava TaxID=342955 RepID=UPI0006E32597|nr:hypothetical protein [Lacinutrix mariniflava]